MRLQARLRALERSERIFLAHRTSAKHGGAANMLLAGRADPDSGLTGSAIGLTPASGGTTAGASAAARAHRQRAPPPRLSCVSPPRTSAISPDRQAPVRIRCLAGASQGLNGH